MDYYHQYLLSLCFCFLYFSPVFSRSSLHVSELPGSKKMTNGRVLKLTTGVSSAIFDPTRVNQLSWRPRAFLYKNFLTDDECDHLIVLAKDKLEKSMVVNNESGESVESEARTSYGMFLDKAQDEVVVGIEERIAAWTFLPVEDPQPKDDNFSDCANTGYVGKNFHHLGFPMSVKPHKGDALLFYSLHPNARTDPLSLHGSCPVIEGEKWSATKWIHVRSFDTPVISDGKCTDENENCAMWAADGECENNPKYMVGSKFSKGSCRKSCKVCTSS